MRRVFVNGTFDLLHRGHVDLLSYARSLGDTLCVAIDSDSRVAALKGPGRPVVRQEDRKAMLEALRSVDDVLIFDSDAELDRILSGIKPSVMVKGEDYCGKPIIGAQHCESVVFVTRKDEHSTSRIIQSILDRG